MTELQRVIKYCAMAFAAFLAFSIITGFVTAALAITGAVSGISSGKTVDVSKSFEDVKSLTIEPGVGTLSLKVGESDKVEVVAENVADNYTVEKNFSGNLIVKSKFNFWNILDMGDNNGKSQITVYIPSDFIAENVDINAGAGNINIEALSTKQLEINAGAGNIKGENIIAKEVTVDGGVGEVTLEKVDLTDVDLDCGVGNIRIQGSMSGKNEIECGVGEVDLKLTGSTDDYNIKIDKGVGTVHINGEKYSDLKWNNITADNSLDIDGGVGNIDIEFE